MDGKPLPVSRHSADAQAKFGRGAGGQNRGYKLHAIYAEKNRPIAWTVTPLNQHEATVATDLIKDGVPRSYLLGDAAYDSNQLYSVAADAGVVLLASRRYRKAKSVGHHRHHPARLDAIDRLQSPGSFARDLLKKRRAVETRFAHLTNFAGGLTHLPPWVRGLHRVQLWVTAKIIIRLARDKHKQTLAA